MTLCLSIVMYTVAEIKFVFIPTQKMALLGIIAIMVIVAVATQNTIEVCSILRKELQSPRHKWPLGKVKFKKRSKVNFMKKGTFYAKGTFYRTTDCTLMKKKKWQKRYESRNCASFKKV